LSIAGRAISELVRAQGVGDLYRIFVSAQRDGVDFNLATMPASFTTELKSPFDPVYMNALFRVGYNRGARGYDWAKFPPGYQDLGAGPKLEAHSQEPQAREPKNYVRGAANQ
jgi:hypothetical protein